MGEMELMSTTTPPSAMPAITPLSPNTTDSTSGESDTMVMTTSALAPTSLGDSTWRAPNSTSSAAFEAVRL